MSLPPLVNVITLYYSDVVADKLEQRNKAGMPEEVAKQHAAVLGAALDGENSSSLVVSRFSRNGATFLSSETSRLFSVRYISKAADFRPIAHVEELNPPDTGLHPIPTLVRYEGDNAAVHPVSRHKFSNYNLFISSIGFVGTIMDQRCAINKRTGELAAHLGNISFGTIPVTKHVTDCLLKKSIGLKWVSARELLVEIYPFSTYGNARQLLEAAGPTKIAELVSYAGSDNVEWSDRGEPTLKFRMFCHEDIPQF
jgi:hypothetical protein